MEFIVICWIGIAIITAVLADQRGRSAFGWFVLGLIFGIFALIFVLILGRALHDPSKASSPLPGPSAAGNFAQYGPPKAPAIINGFELGVYHGYQMIQRADGVHAAGRCHESLDAARAYIRKEVGLP